MRILSNHLRHHRDAFVIECQLGPCMGGAVHDGSELAESVLDESVQLGIDALLPSLEGNVLFELVLWFVGHNWHLLGFLFFRHIAVAQTITKTVSGSIGGIIDMDHLDRYLTWGLISLQGVMLLMDP